MKILVIGQSAREHAIAWKLAASSIVEVVYVAPGNGGTAGECKVRNVSILDTSEQISFAISEGVDFTVVGSAGPLSSGIVDEFEAAGQRIFGPNQAAARLESSKIFSKAFMVRQGIPTPRYWTFSDAAGAKAFVRTMTLPVVIKADGLVKGFEVTVTVASSLAEADGAIDDLCESRQGSEFLVEEFIKGHELSYTVLTDGASIEVLESSRDYKRLMDRDQGPNTGGMGAYSPPRLLDGKLSSAVMASIVQPALAGMAAEGNVFRGFLYVGVIVDSLGNPHALEFNCRLGDPEAQTILMRLDSDLAVVLDACTRSALSTHSLKWKPEACVAVCAVTPEYPAEKRARRVPVMPAAGDVDCKVFHGSTRLGEDGLFATGGRAFCVVAIGSSIDKAKARAYRALEGDSFGELKFRTDIGDEPAHFAALPSWPPQTNT